MYVLETKNDQRPGKTHFGRRQLACSSSSTASTLLIILVLPGYGNEIEDLNSQWEGECSQQSWKFGGLSYLQLFQQCHCKTRTDSVQKVCGGIWRGFDHLTKTESLKVEVVLQLALQSALTLCKNKKNMKKVDLMWLSTHFHVIWNVF